MHDLAKGPGPLSRHAAPGQIGNAAIAGHRTTYLHPFCNVDKLEPGDDIKIQTLAGTFDYEVFDPRTCSTRSARRQPLHARRPTADREADRSWVVDNTPDAELTLTRATRSARPRSAS